jgi:hypothetical protein
MITPFFEKGNFFKWFLKKIPLSFMEKLFRSISTLHKVKHHTYPNIKNDYIPSHANGVTALSERPHPKGKVGRLKNLIQKKDGYYLWK